MGLLVKPKHLYNLQAEKVKLAGFQNVDDFWQDPATRCHLSSRSRTLGR